MFQLSPLLQVYVCSGCDGAPFVELALFPGDTRGATRLAEAFLAWADHIRVTAEARTCYVRNENASWRFGDIGRDPGVFLVLRDGMTPRDE